MIDQPFFLFDCQTTGSRPDQSYIIEAAWGVYQAGWQAADWQPSHFRISLPEGESIPKRIQRLTGLTDHDEQEGQISYQQLCELCFSDWEQAGKPPFLIHFAQFERPFLRAMAMDSGRDPDLLATILCTHRLAKRCLPALRSHSLRAVAGYFDYSLQEDKRSFQHLLATAHVWQHLAMMLADKQPEHVNLLDWLQNYRPAAEQAVRFHSNVDDSKRLALSSGPGIYRMLDKSGLVLYVGKAKNLKSRVNSYFRGRTSKGSRLNEMLTRVDDIAVEQVGSEIEALLKESDEIKRWEPPYNRQLKGRYRNLLFLEDSSRLICAYSKNHATEVLAGKKIGPFHESLLNDTQILIKQLIAPDDSEVNLWGQEFPADFFTEALQLLLNKFAVPDREDKAEQCKLLLDKLAETTILERRLRREEQRHQLLQLTDKQQEESTEDMELEEDLAQAEDEEWDLEKLAYVCEKSLGHFLYRCYYNRWLLRFLECTALWSDSQDQSDVTGFQMQHGNYQFKYLKSMEEQNVQVPKNWQLSYKERCQLVNLTIYDRLSLLYRYWRRLALRSDPIRLCLRPGLVLNEHDLFRYLV